MDFNQALEKLLKIQISLQNPEYTDNPALMSKSMARMAVYAGTIENKLAEYERDYELEQSKLYKELLTTKKMSASAAEKHVKIELGEIRGQVAYLSRVVASAWRQIGVLQSRINHLVKLSETTNI
jgi:triacylglycerol esterase/lipase EstA (alpha/beta hydrolase family)